MYKFWFLTLIFLLIIIPSRAQTLHNKFNVVAGFEFLHSTHATNFKGFSLAFNKRFGNIFEGGVGFEYSHCKYHDDNGFNLYNLKLMPIFFTQRFYFLRKNKLETFFHLREGLSFTGYDKKPQDNPGLREHVNETGFYGYAGLGAEYPLTGNLNVFLEPGIKSFHISANNLDINPHGFNLISGLKYSIR